MGVFVTSLIDVSITHSIKTQTKMASNCLFIYSFALIFILLTFIPTTLSVKCYQCSSGSYPKGDDSCGAYKRFDKEQHIAIECNSDDSHMPGAFCMKVTQQGPKGFIWDGRWRQVIRRCASIADTGVTGVCNWGVFDNGVYWEECYCSSDECNSSPRIQISLSTMAFAIMSTLFLYRLML